MQFPLAIQEMEQQLNILKTAFLTMQGIQIQNSSNSPFQMNKSMGSSMLIPGSGGRQQDQLFNRSMAQPPHSGIGP